MKSINFQILENKWPKLSSLGGFAEKYVYSDPSSAIVKLRSFIEGLVSIIYHELKLPNPPYQSNLFDLIKEDVFCNSIPKAILDKIHTIRIHGNKAVHGEQTDIQQAQELLKEAYDISRWLYIFIGKGNISCFPEYKNPPSKELEDEKKAKLKIEKKHVLEKLSAKEAEMQQLLQELEALRVETKAVQKTADELKNILDEGQKVVDELNFDEETTRRRLIESQLTIAGWDIADTEEITQEEQIKYQQTDNKIVYADYVLWDDNGKPLAVIEAKKTSKDSNDGRTQAHFYADGLEKMHGQRPVIFYTNGFDIWIWDDAQNYPPRRLFGFYSKDSLQYMVNYQQKYKQELNTIKTNKEIANRLYQIEAIKNVTEKFSSKHRKALIVLATGTGKTRVAISLTELLIRANWVKRVLFLCDRRELRKQAKNTFNDFLSEPLTIVKRGTEKDRDKRIYLATYPAMIKIYQSFDVGFFDLIIADESHRSIYNRYRDLFNYFDCLQVGLTATPVEFINRNTYFLFDCEEQNPTAYYSLENAVEDGFLVPYEVYTHTTNFLRKGIKYRDLTDEQKQQLEEDGETPELFDYEFNELDKQIFNKETNRKIIRNLMEKGIKDTTGQHPGKTIIFARNHRHAILLQQLFDEMYPQYGGNFCKVIDNYDPRAEQLIDDFKGIGNNNELNIAISVDMLDTGIDVLEIVNLVFAKPVKSKVKFQQMIGRGTRLCKGLFGPGKDKEIFRIFDHWGNFEYFDQSVNEVETSVPKSLMQRLFEARIDLAEAAQKMGEHDLFKNTIELIQKDINSLPDNTIAVRENWREKNNVSRPEILNNFDPTIVLTLRNVIAPLMQWVNIQEYKDAHEFDLLMTNLQVERLKNSCQFDNFKNDLVNQVSYLQKHLNPVKEKIEFINQIESSSYLEKVSPFQLEITRKELRGIMHYKSRTNEPGYEPKIIDISDGNVEFSHRKGKLNPAEMKAYRKRVEGPILEIFQKDPTLQKIYNGEAISRSDIDKLASLILTQTPAVDMDLLKEFFEQTAEQLIFEIHRIIGLQPEAVKDRFSVFASNHPEMTSKQLTFLGLLQNYISKYGAIEIDRLYETPFINIDSNGLDGVFPDELVADEIVAIIESFKPHNFIKEDRV